MSTLFSGLKVVDKEAWNMMGAGLAAAWDKLNDKRPANAYRLSLPGEGTVESLLDAVGDSLTQVELVWTPRRGLASASPKLQASLCMPDWHRGRTA